MYHCMVFTMKFLASLNPSARQVATSLPGRCSLRHRLGTDGATQLCGAGAVRDTARKGVAKQPTMGKWGPWWAMYIYIYVGQFIPLVPGALGATLKIVIYIINKSAQAVSPTALVIGKVWQQPEDTYQVSTPESPEHAPEPEATPNFFLGWDRDPQANAVGGNQIWTTKVWPTNVQKFGAYIIYRWSVYVGFKFLREKQAAKPYSWWYIYRGFL